MLLLLCLTDSSLKISPTESTQMSCLQVFFWGSPESSSFYSGVQTPKWAPDTEEGTALCSSQTSGKKISCGIITYTASKRTQELEKGIQRLGPNTSQRKSCTYPRKSCSVEVRVVTLPLQQGRLLWNRHLLNRADPAHALGRLCRKSLPRGQKGDWPPLEFRDNSGASQKPHQLQNHQGWLS